METLYTCCCQVGAHVLETVDRLMGSANNEAHVANVETKAANR